MPTGIYIRTKPAWNKGIGWIPWNKGKSIRLNPQGEFKKGHKGFWLGKKRPNISGEKHFGWKGDAVKYRALHNWVEKRLGKPMCCDNCGTTNLGRYNWANKSHEYKREITDWIRLCVSCHKKYDACLTKEVGQH